MSDLYPVSSSPSLSCALQLFQLNFTWPCTLLYSTLTLFTDAPVFSSFLLFSSPLLTGALVRIVLYIYTLPTHAHPHLTCIVDVINFSFSSFSLSLLLSLALVHACVSRVIAVITCVRSHTHTFNWRRSNVNVCIMLDHA